MWIKSITQTPEQWYNRGMNAIVRLVADGLMIPIVAVALFALFFRAPHAQRYQRYTRVFMAGLTSYWCAKVIGALWQPETLRPFEKLGTDPGALYLNNPGFPSDHALFAMFLTLAVWYVTRRRLLTCSAICYDGVGVSWPRGGTGPYTARCCWWGGCCTAGRCMVRATSQKILAQTSKIGKNII